MMLVRYVEFPPADNPYASDYMTEKGIPIIYQNDRRSRRLAWIPAGILVEMLQLQSCGQPIQTRRIRPERQGHSLAIHPVPGMPCALLHQGRRRRVVLISLWRKITNELCAYGQALGQFANHARAIHTSYSLCGENNSGVCALKARTLEPRHAG